MTPSTYLHIRTAVAAAVLALAAAACTPTPAGPATTMETAKGKTLVDAKGMTLYVFDRDQGGKSACNGPCATNWPPLMAVASAQPSGEWSVIARDDGARQWAYRGRPLYTWSKDTKPGDITGDGFLNGAWHVAQP
jgi:predicted lipoprotein with Yx(FWY)xxD motif